MNTAAINDDFSFKPTMPQGDVAAVAASPPEQGDIAAIVASLLQQGKSAAEVWNVLVSQGVDPAVAEARIRDGVWAAQVRQEEWRAAAREAEVSYARQAEGSFAKGFVCGFFFGCFALIAVAISNDIGSKTKQGVMYGFFTALVFSIVRLLAVSH